MDVWSESEDQGLNVVGLIGKFGRATAFVVSWVRFPGGGALLVWPWTWS